MRRDEIIEWLRESDAQRLESLWAEADTLRREHVGNAVHLRGLLEISNHCVRACAYCGLGTANRRGMRRYRMTEDEILASAREAVGYGYGTVVLQSGEDPAITRDWMAGVVRRIKQETPLAVTLSLGERSQADLEAWRTAGADRYLLRFETSDRALYDRIHPPLSGRRSDRFAILAALAALGYEVGSGVMVGLPGQTYGTLANDILAFERLDLDMVGLGPYIPHPQTSLGAQPDLFPPAAQDPVPATEEMTYKTLALTRILCPEANIPSTTALATLNRDQGREFGLMRGANVVMPNVTPARYRVLYEIYPGKACLHETAEVCNDCIKARIRALGREIGAGRGDSVRRRKADARAVASA